MDNHFFIFERKYQNFYFRSLQWQVHRILVLKKREEFRDVGHCLVHYYSRLRAKRKSFLFYKNLG